MRTVSFADTSIVACATMSLELNHLKDAGELEGAQLLYTAPGLHQNIPELERQLIEQIKKGKEQTSKVIVVYGGKFCYVNPDEPTRLMQTIIEEQSTCVVRIEATHCMDMIASDEERKRIADEEAGGEPVWWMTPGWIKFRKDVFKGWDKGLANENFPRHSGGAIILDSIGYMDTYMEEHPEEFLEYSDWMGIPIIPYSLPIDRFLSLLYNAAERLV